MMGVDLGQIVAVGKPGKSGVALVSSSVKSSSVGFPTSKMGIGKFSSLNPSPDMAENHLVLASAVLKNNRKSMEKL